MTAKPDFAILPTKRRKKRMFRLERLFEYCRSERSWCHHAILVDVAHDRLFLIWFLLVDVRRRRGLALPFGGESGPLALGGDGPRMLGAFCRIHDVKFRRELSSPVRDVVFVPLPIPFRESLMPFIKNGRLGRCPLDDPSRYMGLVHDHSVLKTG